MPGTDIRRPEARTRRCAWRSRSGRACGAAPERRSAPSPTSCPGWLERWPSTLTPLALELGRRSSRAATGSCTATSTTTTSCGTRVVYVAIDPKPYLADREYDVYTWLHNPLPYVMNRDDVERRIAHFVAAGLDDHRIRAWAIVRGAYLGGQGVEAEVLSRAARLEEDPHPGRLALAVEMLVAAAAARPLREQDPAQMREADGDAGGEGGQELGMPHDERIVADAAPFRMGRPAHRCAVQELCTLRAVAKAVHEPGQLEWDTPLYQQARTQLEQRARARRGLRLRRRRGCAIPSAR